MSYFLVGILIVVVILVLIVFWAVGTANKLTRCRNKVLELESDVDVALEKRYDLLRKEYDVVKSYMSYESQTIIKTIQYRSGMPSEEKAKAMENINKLARQINATFEAYPTLKSSENVMALQKSCINAEEHLQAARRLYNSGVTNYNNLCRMFPYSIVASMTGNTEMPYYKIDDYKRKDVNMSL
ncbi:MAG: LemA family protein [Coprococcus sp.]